LDLYKTIPCYTGTNLACEFRDNVIDQAKDIDSAYQAANATALAEFLKAPFVMPSETAQKQPIDLRLVKPGEHIIYVSIVPEELDSKGGWTFEYKAYVERSGVEERFLDGRFDSQTCNCKQGQRWGPTPAGYFTVALIQ
jgi:hypothetical protein